MSRKVKEMIEVGLTKQCKGLESILVVNVHPLTGVEANAFRRHLGKKQIAVHVIKNTVAKRVLKDTGLRGLAPALIGPCAWVTGGVSAPDVAKELIALVKDYPKLELRCGILEGEAQTMTIQEIARLKTRTEMQGDIVGLFTSPARRIAGCLNVGGKIAGCIKAVVDKLEKGEAIAKVA